MSFSASGAFWTVGGALLVLGLVLLLAVPAPALVVLALAAAHLGIAAVLRAREQRRRASGR